ncbi:hypothetical protein NE237_005574 [Protea cynaroides]|uniref:Uncharacterized protein n=1 Tax=Protea cynaroides TaxID=273540 RepID=A0A9Q0GLF8_9MAGN|nr:hypothetical protein NE237_005574 [Protea cynaroides]
MLVNRVGSFPRNCGFFDSLPKSRLEDHACASTFSEASNSLIFCNTRLNEAPLRQEKIERSGGGAGVRRREKSLGKSTFIEKRGISSVLSPILDKRAPVLSFAEVVKKGSLSSVPCAANSKEGAEKEKFWIAKPRAPSYSIGDSKTIPSKQVAK